MYGQVCALECHDPTVLAQPPQKQKTIPTRTNRCFRGCKAIDAVYYTAVVVMVYHCCILTNALDPVSHNM